MRGGREGGEKMEGKRWTEGRGEVGGKERERERERERESERESERDTEKEREGEKWRREFYSIFTLTISQCRHHHHRSPPWVTGAVWFIAWVTH